MFFCKGIKDGLIGTNLCCVFLLVFYSFFHGILHLLFIDFLYFFQNFHLHQKVVYRQIQPFSTLICGHHNFIFLSKLSFIQMSSFFMYFQNPFGTLSQHITGEVVLLGTLRLKVGGVEVEWRRWKINIIV
jgi:hypothetical protein